MKRIAAWSGCARNQGCFSSRPRSTVCFLDREHEQVLDLEQIGPQAVGQSLDREVLVGKEAKLPARLIMVRVPDDVVEQRQARIRADAKRRGQGQANLQSLARVKWAMLITNVSREKLSVREVLVLQRARWQIERLFRLGGCQPSVTNFIPLPWTLWHTVSKGPRRARSQ